MVFSESVKVTPMGNTFEGLLAGSQVGLPRLRLALAEALDSGLDRREASQLLLAHALISLGRAHCLSGSSDAGIDLLAEAMDIHPAVGSHVFLDLLIRQAEEYIARGEWQKAICNWQDIATLLGAQTPDFVYQELSYAYAKNCQGFGGSLEENHCWGDCHKHEVLAFLQEVLKPKLYLEIGVDEGLSLARARGPAIGIDPRPDLSLKVQLPDSTRILQLSSDAFFRDEADQQLFTPPELIFIDGMHLFEFVLRDFMDVERHACSHSLVVIDDIYPCHPVQAARRRRSNAWTGDVWKFHHILQRERPDLTLLTLNSYTTGLLLIAGLNPQNTCLQSVYSSLVSEFRPIHRVPEIALVRQGAIPSSHPVLADLLRCLKKAKDEHWNVAEVQAGLRPVREKAKQVAVEFQVQAGVAIDPCDLTSLADALSEDQAAELRA